MIDALRQKLGERVRENEILAKHTHFRIGGPARYFFEAKSSDDLRRAVESSLESSVRFFILGGGSNVLISDEGFSGLVIKSANRNFEINGNRVTAESGVLTSMLACKTAEAGLSGLEWAASLPGTIGGAVRGNSGCFGGETKDSLVSVRVLKIDNGKIEEKFFLKDECEFDYRDSIFKHLRSSPVILSVEFELKPEDSQKCLACIEANIASRKEKQPFVLSSAGCIFKNFEFANRDEIVKLESRLRVPVEFIANRRISAAWLVEQVGLKGMKIGDAQVSDQHANFILNVGNATASDVVQLISIIKMKVRDELGIQLHEELQLIGF